MPKIVIAIDGPAGAGKSTVSKLLVEKLGLQLLDTGAMYRCIAIKAQRLGLEQAGGTELAELALGTQITFTASSDAQLVLLDGSDVTRTIRDLSIGQLASKISVHPELRKVLVGKQQEVLSGGGFVIEGRDVTTVVAPQAELRIFLTASIEERARRRWLELESQGSHKTLQEVVKDVVERDHRDYTRADSPLQLAEEAIIIESFGKTPEEIAEEISALARNL